LGLAALGLVACSNAAPPDEGCGDATFVEGYWADPATDPTTGGSAVFWYDPGDPYTPSSGDPSADPPTDNSGDPGYYETSDNGDSSAGDGTDTTDDPGAGDPSGGDPTASPDDTTTESHGLHVVDDHGLLRPTDAPHPAAPGCYECTMLCTLEDGATERAADGASSHGYDAACAYAVHRIENWAHHDAGQKVVSCADVSSGPPEQSPGEPATPTVNPQP
jgi:hypothetical protein